MNKIANESIVRVLDANTKYVYWDLNVFHRWRRHSTATTPWRGYQRLAV
jgi:hypothetical protein